MNKSSLIFGIWVILLVHLSFSDALSQPLQISVAQPVLEQEGLKALMVSNQYGVLRYFAFQHKLETDSAHIFSVMRRRGEQLALTLVTEEDRDGLFSFSNITYTGLEDGTRIRLPEEARESRAAFKTVDLEVEGVNGARDVKLLGPLGKRTSYSVSGGNLEIRGFLKEGVGVLALIQLPEAEKYQYFMAPMTRNNRFVIPLAALGDSIAYRKIEMPYSAKWEGRIEAFKNGTPYYLAFQPQPPSEASKFVRYAWPVGMRFDSIQLRLSALREEGSAYFGTYDVLPDQLDSFRFVEGFSSLESKGFTFEAAEEEGEYYAVSYYYSLGEGMPIPSWHVWGSAAGRDTVDFILPDLPAELYEMVPELNEVVNPIAVDKTSFHCTHNCGMYTYGKDPAALQDSEQRFFLRFVTRRKLRDFEE